MNDASVDIDDDDDDDDDNDDDVAMFTRELCFKK